MQSWDIKRFIDTWNGDDEFRTLFLDTPSLAIQNWDLHAHVKEVHPFCVEQYIKGNHTLLGIESLPGLEAYRTLLQHRASQINAKQTAHFTNSAFNSWLLRQINYFRTQVPDAWAANNPHIPIAVELTHGCSMACPFCAGAAEPLAVNLPSYNQYREQFSTLLTLLKQFLGLKKARGLLYYFTEPFDHPEYEDYLRTAHHLLNGLVSTTTAAWFRNIPRTRSFLDMVQNLEIPYNRFSINSKKQFRKCMEEFSPQELMHVGLVYNYPQAAESILCAAGRGKNISSAILGSVACVTGFLVNLPLQRIQLVSPTLEIEKWPKGYRVLAEGHGLNTKDLDSFLQFCHHHHFNASLHADSRVKLREDLQLTFQNDRWYLINNYRRFPLQQFEHSLAESLFSPRKVQEMTECAIPESTSNQIYARLNTWWANGLLEIHMHSEDKQSKT